MKRLTIIISILLYVIALTQDCFDTYKTGGNQLYEGFYCLTTGWLGILAGHLPALVWLANPILIFSWIKFKSNSKLSFILSIISSIFILSFLSVDYMMLDEAGHLGKIRSWNVGYWLWLSSSLTMVVGGYFRLNNNKQIVK